VTRFARPITPGNKILSEPADRACRTSRAIPTQANGGAMDTNRQNQETAPTTGEDYKKYTQEARRGIKGEAFFEMLVVDHAIPHRIARQNDLGIDFLCEWTYGDHPTGILFSAQVKTSTSDTVKCEEVGKSKLNGLIQYTLTDAPKPDDRTLNYWKGLGLPAFLFMAIEDTASGRVDCYHKRYTPLLDGHTHPDDENRRKLFFRVNSESKFLAFADADKEIGGFARDLIIDHARLSYSKGHIVQLTRGQLGFWPFPDKREPNSPRYFREIIGWNLQKIVETRDWTTDLLTRLGLE
jgi:hypothetical protein